MLSSEKPMLLEKPIAFKSNFLKKLLKKNKKNCKNKFVGFNRRFYKTTQKLYKRLLKNDLIYADIRVTENYNEIINKYGSKIKNRINYVTATTHVIDLVIFLFGQLRIKSLKIIKAKRNKCSSFFVNCRNKKNIIVNISIFNQNPSNTGITCYFSDGTTWDLSPLEVLSIYDKYNVQINKKNKLRFYKPSLLRKYRENNNKYKQGFYNQLSEITKKKIQYASSIDSNINLLKFFDNLKRNEK